MRKVCCILTGIFLSLLFTTCKQFTADIDDYLSYWSTVVSSAGYSIDKPTQTSADGSMCVPSADNLTVTVKLNNPKNVRLIMPDKGNVIRFPGLSTQPVYGTDYTLEQKTSDTLTLEYKSTFLGTHEWSNGDIGPEITFIATDGRIFPSKFSLNLKVDTAPAALEYAEIGKTATADSDGNHFYVLIFRVKDMDYPITDSSIHKDIKKLIVTAGGVPSEIPLSFNAGKTDFETGGDLLAESALHVLDIDHPLPGGNWLLCLKTDVKVGEAEKEYAVSIKDVHGLSSAVIRASTQKNKLANVQLFDGSTEITGTSDSNPKGIPGINGKTLTAKALDGALITGTVYKKKADGTWEQLSGSGGTVSGTTPVTVNLPALAASGTEALYKISLKAQLSGYDDSDSKDFFVKLLWQEVPVLKIRQRFDPFDGVHSISAETKGYVTEDIIPDAGQYTNANPLVIYNYLDGGYSFELSASAGSTVKYRLGGNPEQSATTSAVISVSHSVVHKLEVWAERDAIAGPHTTLYSKGVQAVSNYTQLKNVAQNAPANGTRIEIVIGDNITASADTEIAVTGGKKLILQSSPSTTVRTVNAGGLGRILKVSGTGSQLELNGIQLTGGNAADGKGGAVCVEAGGVLWLYNKTVITPSTGSDINTPGKNDVYLANGAEITLGSLTTTEPIVARITPNYTDGNTVLTGSPASVSTNYTKFSVTQPDDGFLWKIKSDGTLKAIPTIINGSDSGAWQKLRELVRIAPAGAVITINGTITATNEGSGDTANWGEIIIDKNLTIKGKKTDRTDTLNANKDDFGTVPFRIFKVELGKKLTLENLTLKNGKNNETDPGGSPNPNGKGGAIYSKGELEIRNVRITNCEAKYSGGGIYCSMFGTTSTDERKLVIENTEVASCKALDTTHGLGGGVSIQGSDCLMNVKITDVMIKNNDAGSSAAGLCLYGNHNATTTADSVVLTRVTLHTNKLTGTSAAGGAGMVFATYGPNNAITLKNCTVTKNESTTIGGGISLRTSSSGVVSGKLILENSRVTENKAQNGGGVYVNWSNLVMKNTDFTSNTATAEGGGVYVKNGTITMESCTLSSNTARYGGGIQADNGNHTVKDCTLTNNEAYLYGGGIYVTGGSLTLNNTTIGGKQFYDGTDHGKTKGNKAKQGGGVYIEGNGTSFTMNGGSIQYNKTIDGDGGGVYIKGDGTSFTMNGGKITQCKTDVTSPGSSEGRGGGIYIYGDNASSPINITIKGTAEISHNESTSQGASLGGGIYGGSNSIITVSENATIKNNEARGFGGGVYIEDTFKFTGGTITGNTASVGAGIFSINSSTTLKMSGNARVTNDNDIYLHSNSVITITGGALTGTAPVARITPATYNTTTQVLTADTGVTLANETYKFAVTPKGSEKWTVGGNGCLKEGRYTEVPYGQLETYLANASSTEVNYIEVTGISAADLTGSYGSPPDPGALGQKIKNNSAKKVALKLPSGLSVTDMSACFSQCENLVSLENFPSGVTDMRACFYGCENLTTVPAIPATVTSMMECFYRCENLTTALNIPAGVYDMTRCFQYCEKLQSIKMNCPYGVNFNGAFSGCDALPNGGIQVPSAQLGTYKANAGTMGTSADKFSAIP